QHDITGGQRNRPAGPSFADDCGDERHLDVETSFDRTCDRLGLAPRFRVDAGVGAGSIDQRKYGQAGAVGEPHQTPRLAISFRPPHAKIVLEPALGICALFGPEHEDTAPAKAADAADDCRVLGECAIAGEWHELGDQSSDVVEEMRPFRVPGYLNL